MNHKMVSHDSLIWADAADKFDAGTPAILCAIALTKALQIIQAGSKNLFSGSDDGIAPPSQILRFFQAWMSGLSGGDFLHLTGLSLELCRQRTASTQDEWLAIQPVKTCQVFRRIFTRMFIVTWKLSQIL